MPDIIDRFRGSYYRLNSISERREAHCVQALRRYEEFLSLRAMPIEQASDGELREYLVSLLDAGLAASTVGWHLKMIKPFYNWCHQEQVVDRDHVLRIRDVSAPRGAGQQDPKPYSRRELAQMWVDLDAKFPKLPPVPARAGGRHPISRWRNGTSRFNGKLKRHAMRLQLEAMIELALVCGLRRIEIYRLSIDDCHWDNKYIVVDGKRENQHAKKREVPYPDSTRNAIREWFRMRGMMGAEHDSLWLSVTGPNPIAPLSWDRMVNLLHSFGPWVWHRLRHTCATERLRAKMPIEQLQKFLGHSDIAMTMRYVKLVREDVHAAAAKTEAEFQRAIHAAA